MSTPNLPAEQEKLLRELNEVDTLERLGILPERSNINLFLIGFVWTLGIFISIANIVNNASTNLTSIFIFCIITSIGLSASYYNKSWGSYLSSLSVLIGNAFFTYQLPGHHSDFSVLLDGLTVFIFSNQFGRNGFIAASTMVILKTTGILVEFRGKKDLENYFANLIIICAVGIIPVLIRAISQFSRNAKRQEIRAAILALQNQDLLASWQNDVYKTTPQINAQSASTPPQTQPEQKATVTQSQPFTEVSLENSIYSSPYQESNIKN